jgi:8-oxo-dGTP pyrophosphatase MutT (NUDIX family)
MQVVYANQPFPDSWTKTIFLVGPTPRDTETKSWRPEALKILEELGFDGTVFVPEDDNWGVSAEYIDQVEWEKAGLTFADVLAVWVPRELQSMPAFTTNVEFGRWITSGKIVYGRPDGSPKNRYLDWMTLDEGAGPVHNDLREMLKAAIEHNGKPVLRRDGERHVPLHIWNTPQFGSWYGALVRAGNRLDDAKVLWHFRTPKLATPFAWALWVKVWITVERRHKANEFVFKRTDISTVVLFRRPPSRLTMSEEAYLSGSVERLLDHDVVIVREFRSAARTEDGYIRELPGGSSWTDEPPLMVAVEETTQETGLTIDESRFRAVAARQVAGTLSSHFAYCYAVDLTADEMEIAVRAQREHVTQGVEEDSERTYVEVTTVRDLVRNPTVDWATLGMVLSALVD